MGTQTAGSLDGVPPADGGPFELMASRQISQLVTQLFTYYDAFQKAQIDLQVELAEGLELGDRPRNSRAHCSKYDK